MEAYSTEFNEIDLHLKIKEMDTELARKDAKIAELREVYKKWHARYKRESEKVERYREKAKEVNNSEIEQLERENIRLRAEVNQLKRDRRDAKKYKKIYTIVTGEEIE